MTLATTLTRNIEEISWLACEQAHLWVALRAAKSNAIRWMEEKRCLESVPALIFYISQNFIMARFAAFERSKLHQTFMTASISP